MQSISAAERPAFALFGHRADKEAAVVIRGTNSIQDVVTDIRAMPVPFPSHVVIEGNKRSFDLSKGTKELQARQNGKPYKIRVW